MINKCVFALVAAAFLFTGVSRVQAQTQIKLGTVDMKKVFENYYKTKDAEQRINEARNAAKKELEDRMEDYKKRTDEVQKLNDDIQRPELSPSAKDLKSKQRDEKISELKNMEREIRDFQASREKQLQEQTLRMRSGIVDEITKVINDQVKANQFDLVLDRSGQSLNGVDIVLYAKDSYDFTTDVITTLNKNKSSSDDTSAPAAAATAPAATKPASTPKKK
jgi:outer membrane protein